MTKIINALKNANYGKVKVWTNRIRANLSFLQFLMVTALYFENIEFEWWHLLVVVGFVLLSIYDNDEGLRQEAQYMARKNDLLMDIHNKIMRNK